MKVITKMTAAAVVTIVLVTSQVSQADQYTFQGTNFTDFPAGSGFFTTSDSLTGSMTINNPPTSGACTGSSWSAGNQASYWTGATGAACDITALSFSSGGETLAVGDADYHAGNSVVSWWAVEFDGSNEITRWTLALSGPTGSYGGVNAASPNFATEKVRANSAPSTPVDWLQTAGTFARQDDGSAYGDARTERNFPGSWTLVPEPTSAILLSLGLVTMLGCGRRNRR